MLSGISPLSILLILLIVVLLFGTKKLRNVGSDIGGAIKSFRKAVKDEGQDSANESSEGKEIPAQQTQDHKSE